MNSIKKLKEIKPDSLVVFGGANAEIHPSDNIRFLEETLSLKFIFNISYNNIAKQFYLILII